MTSHLPTLTFDDLDHLRDAVYADGCTWAQPTGPIGSLIHTFEGFNLLTGEPSPSNLYGGRAFVTEQWHAVRWRYTVRIVTHRPRGHGWGGYACAVIGAPGAFLDPLSAHIAAARVGALHRDGFVPAYLHDGDANRLAGLVDIPPFIPLGATDHGARSPEA
jgi:hypothetical protein